MSPDPLLICQCPWCRHDASYDTPASWPDPTHSRYPPDTPLWALQLSAHVYNTLLRGHLFSTGDVERLSKRELLALRGFGLGCYAELMAALGRPEEPSPVRPPEPPVVRWADTLPAQRKHSRWNVRSWRGCQAAAKWPVRTIREDGQEFEFLWLRCGNRPMQGSDLCGLHQRRLDGQTA